MSVTTVEDVREAVAELAERWRGGRAERQSRRHLEAADFAALADTGFLRLAVPEDQGGTWRSVGESTRGVAETLRSLARADPSVALVSSMHPAVVGFWLCNPDPAHDTWSAQRGAVFEAAAASQWGTVTSEPGSGGDITRTRTQAVAAGDGPGPSGLPGRVYELTGDKHFGSGFGICHFMFTTAVAAGEDEPSAYFLDTRPAAGGAAVPGATVVAEWDGAGMAATQSHAVRLEAAAATRVEWPAPLTDLALGAAPLVSALFTAVVLGILDEVVATAATQLQPKSAGLRPYEQVEWARAEMEHWLAVQAYEGMLAAAEGPDAYAALRAALRGKTAVAELAEQVLVRCTRVLGGGTFSRRSPFSSWFEDVRALGFLRPPWGLAYDSLYLTSFG